MRQSECKDGSRRLAPNGPSRVLRAVFGWASVCLVALLVACASGPEPVAPAPAEPVSAAPKLVPAEVAAELARFAGRAEPEAVGRIALRDEEFGPQGARLLVAQGTGPLCIGENCAVGVFASEAGRHRPVLLAMASAQPALYPLGHLGQPDIGLRAIDSAREFRLTRYQWDGRQYSPSECRLVNRLTQESRLCVPTHPDDVALLERPPVGLCGEMREMVLNRAPRANSALSDAFVVRSDAAALVEALRVRGGPSPDLLGALVRCLRSNGIALARMKNPIQTRSLATTGWVAEGIPTRDGAKDITLTATYVARADYTLVSLGVFASHGQQ